MLIYLYTAAAAEQRRRGALTQNYSFFGAKFTTTQRAAAQWTPE